MTCGLSSVIGNQSSWEEIRSKITIKIGKLCLPDLTVFCRKAFHRIASIDNAMRPVQKIAVIENLVGSANYDCVEGAYRRFVPGDRFVPCPVGMLACGSDYRNVRVMIGDLSATGVEHLEQVKGWRLAHIVDVRFVGEAKDQDL